MSTGFTGHTAGWAVAEHDTETKRWRWWARFDAEIREGHESTWAQAIGAAKKAFKELEKNSPAPEGK